MSISRNFSFSSRARLPFGQATAARSAELAWSGLGAALRRLVPALARRRGAGQRLEHLETLPLTAQSSVALIRAGAETLLLGITPQGISLLARNPAPALESNADSALDAQGSRR